jgi:hypothetical protein
MLSAAYGGTLRCNLLVAKALSTLVQRQRSAYFIKIYCIEVIPRCQFFSFNLRRVVLFSLPSI